jgi:glutathione S-transferase
MKLYFSPGACSLSPHIVAREAGIPIELVKVDLTAKTLADGGDFNGVNGKGYVPALRLDDGSVLTEGPAIVQYLADRNPEAGLVPRAGTPERYRLQEWLNFLTAEVHKTWGALFNPKLAGEWKHFVLDLLARRLEHVARALEGKPYLMGERFSVADAYLFTLLNWAGWTGVDLGRWPALRDYAARIAQRPQVQEALRAEGLVK